MVYIDNTETLSYLFRLSKQNVTLTLALYDWDQISVFIWIDELNGATKFQINNLIFPPKAKAASRIMHIEQTCWRILCQYCALQTSS